MSDFDPTAVRLSALQVATATYGQSLTPEEVVNAAAQFEAYLRGDGGTLVVPGGLPVNIIVNQSFESSKDPGPTEVGEKIEPQGEAAEAGLEGDGEPDPTVGTIVRSDRRDLVSVMVFPGDAYPVGITFNGDVDLTPDEAITLASTLITAANRANRG